MKEDEEEEPQIDIAPAVTAMFQLRKPRMTKTKATGDISDKPRRKLKVLTEALINIACDHIASGTMSVMLANGKRQPEEILKLPYPGSKALLRICDKWITSRYKDAIYRARRTHKMRTYCNNRHKWREGQFDLVHWEAIGAV